MVGSMGLPWNNSFEYFAWNSTIHQSCVVNSSLGWLPNEKGKFYVLILQIKKIITFLSNLQYKLLRSMQDKKKCSIQIKGNFI